MNHAQVVDHELRLYNQFKSEGRRLLHLCPDWDFMTIHSEMDEIAACCCDFELESDNILRDEKASAVNERHAGLEALKRHDEDMAEEKRLMVAAETQSTSQDFSTLGAPAHSGTDLGNRVAVACMLVSNPAFRKDGWQKQVNDLLREMRDRLEKQQ